MHKLVLLRHGESAWNAENRFAGWVDVDLTAHGIEQAKACGRLLREGGFDFDLCYSSVLKRSTRTLWHCLDAMDRTWLPAVHSWRLNERHYGALQGLDKKQTAREFGQEQVRQWRRSHDAPAPPLATDDPRWERGDIRYARLKPHEMPRGESLQDVLARVLPLWNESIAPVIRSGRRVLLTAHGNSIRALLKHLDDIPDRDIVDLNIPNGIPLVYELDAALRPLRHYYLGDPEVAARAAEAVANQAQA